MTDSNERPSPPSKAPDQPVKITAIEERLNANFAELEIATVRVRTLVHKELAEIPLVL
jgi:hypothetical protein